MAYLFGKQFTKDELLGRIGDISQIAGARQIKLVGGFQDGVDAVEFRTGSGFSFLAVPGRGLDITIAQYCGKSLSWRHAAGEVAASYFDDKGLGWLRSFPGGLVTTCGLTNAGAPSEDGGEALGLHGRISNTPASNIWVDGAWEGDEYKMWAQGKMREARFFGENIVLQRKITAVLGENRLFIDDVVTNEGSRTSPHMFLYHINGGYPVVDEGSVLVSPTISATPRDAEAEIDKEHYYRMDAPTKGFKERCYYHDMSTDADGNTCSALINKNMPDGSQFGFYVKWNKNQLPEYTEWKQNGWQDYVVGMEPANCHVEGRDVERARGALKFIEPGESKKYSIEIGVLTNTKEVAEFETLVESLRR